MPSYKTLWEKEKEKNKKLLEMLFDQEIIQTGMWDMEADNLEITKEEYKEDWILSLEAFLEEIGGEDY